jgi:DNA-binding CsgD family transcriptional regulator
MYFDPNQFSERENDVVKLLLEGKGNKEIALQLGISSRTVEFHLSNIYRKLNVRSRSEAILRLTGTRLRGSTGIVQEDSTVAETGVSAENEPKPVFWRPPVKPVHLILGGLTTILLAALVVYRLSVQGPGTEPVPSPTPIRLMNTSTAAVSATTAPASTTIPFTLSPRVPATSIPIDPHTVNGYTAAIVASYADASHISFQVRITDPQGHTGFSKDYVPGVGNLYDEYGRLLNASAGYGPAADPTLIEFGFVPVTLLKGDRIKGEFAFDLENPKDFNQAYAQFRFDFDLPLYPDVRFYPKQSVTANGLEMLLDSVTISPTFTQAYVCFIPPDSEPWFIGRQAVIQVAGQEASLYGASELFSSATGSYLGAQSEPYWVPPVKNGSCYKIIFPLGSDHASSLTLIIPDLERFQPDGVPSDQLARDYPALSPRDAYHKYLEEHDGIYKGPWIFRVELVQ